MLQDCKYRLPCNWCDKYNRMCEAVLTEIHIQEQEKNECEHEWRYGIKSNIGYHYICKKCGTMHVAPLSSLG